MLMRDCDSSSALGIQARGLLPKLLCLVALLAPFQKAAAELVLVTCAPGTNSVTFEPGLTHTPQDVFITGQSTYGICATVVGDPVTSATWSIGPVLFPGNSCDNFFSSYRSVITVQWNTGETSTILFNTTKLQVQGTTAAFVQTGTVTAGKYVGNRAVQTITYLNEDLENGCTAPSGLTRLDGPATLTIATLL